MKAFSRFLLAISVLTSLNAFAQKNLKQTDDRKVYTKAEQMPVYPGGKGAMVKFILDHMSYSEDVKHGGSQSGTVFVQFIVSPNGKVIEPKVTKSISAELDNEAIKIVNLMPKWKAGKQDGKAVFVYQTVQVKFALKD